jgi:hypothetical protein
LIIHRLQQSYFIFDMADRTTILRSFNSHFFEFLDDVILIVPNSTDLAVAKTSFDTIKRANPTSIIKAWHTYVYVPYESVIDSGNISFFIEKDYKSDLAYLANSNEIMNTIDKIREPIRNMSEVNQAHSLKYIQNLSKLSKLYVVG